jgi:hypothetical protein
VRVDPREHTHWEVHALNEWQGILSPALFARVSRWMHARESDVAQYLCADDQVTVPDDRDSVSAPERIGVSLHRGTG